MPIAEPIQMLVRTIVSKRLADRRRELKLTLREVAEVAGVSDTMVSDYEKGTSDYPLASLLQICLALKMSFEDIVVDFTASTILNAIKRLQPFEKDSPARTRAKAILAGGLDSPTATVAENRGPAESR